jgi:hypothetical protein
MVVQTMLLLAAFLIQYQVMFPIESLFIDPASSSIVSFVFLPHGVKTILLALTGPAAIIPVFLSQLISDLVLGHTLNYSVISSFESVIALIIPLMLLNYMTNNRTLASLRLDMDYNLSLIRIVLALAVMQGLINSLIRSVIHEQSGLSLLSFRYLSGDIVGTILVLGLVILLRRHIIMGLRKLI